jgi:ADP-heptose:LPS heptosyltransferase
VTPIDEVARRIGGFAFSHAVVFWSTARVAAIVARAGIRVRVGQSRRLYSWRYTIRVPVRTETGDKTSHWTDVQMDYARALGATDEPNDYRIIVPFGPADSAHASAIIERDAPGGTFVVWHAARGMRLDGVQWPVESFARIGDALGRQFDAPVLLTGSADEARVIGRIADQMHGRRASIAGQTSLRELAALLSRAAVVVALDSGPMHIAAAVGAPTVGIFGLRTDLPKRWRPLGDHVAVIEPSFPCPAWHRKENCKTFDCYRALDERVIVAAARSVAGARTPA